MTLQSTDNQVRFNALNYFCKTLQLMLASDFEEKMVCTLDCCIGNALCNSLESFLKKDVYGIAALIGADGMALLKQLYEALDEALYYDDKKGFTKEQHWQEFCALVMQVVTHIQKRVPKVKNR